MAARPGRETFSRAERLQKRSEFLRVQRTGRKVRTTNFLLFVLRHEQGVSRIGITVSRKVGSAVVRNRVKRLVREAFRRNKAKFPLHADIVVVARPSAAALEYVDVASELVQAW